MWPEWLDFALLAMRTAVSASTHQTPFEMVFGRSWNPLRNYHQILPSWSSVVHPDASLQLAADEELSSALAHRAQLLRHHLDLSVQARRQWTLYAVGQRAGQDASHFTTAERVQPGAVVWLVNELRSNKLDHKFVGPFTVVGDADPGVVSSNYLVRDSVGHIRARSVPRDKLFVAAGHLPSPRQSALFADGEIAEAGADLSFAMPGPISGSVEDGNSAVGGEFAISHISASRRALRGPGGEVLVHWVGYPVPEWLAESAIRSDILDDLLAKWRRSQVVPVSFHSGGSSRA